MRQNKVILQFCIYANKISLPHNPQNAKHPSSTPALYEWHCFFTNYNLNLTPVCFPQRLNIFLQLILHFFSCSVSINSEKAMAPHSSTLAWKIPWTEEPGWLQSMGLRRVGHNWMTSLSLFTFMHWRRKWQPTPVFLPGESQGRGSLMGCRLWGHTESGTTDAT